MALKLDCAWIALALLVLTASAGAVSDLLALQGNVYSGGVPLALGDLRAYLYSDSVCTVNFYDSGADFNNAIVNGQYDVMLGNASLTALTIDSSLRYVYLTTAINGVIQNWNSTSGKCLPLSNPFFMNNATIDQRIDVFNASLPWPFAGGNTFFNYSADEWWIKRNAINATDKNFTLDIAAVNNSLYNAEPYTALNNHSTYFGTLNGSLWGFINAVNTSVWTVLNNHSSYFGTINTSIYGDLNNLSGYFGSFNTSFGSRFLELGGNNSNQNTNFKGWNVTAGTFLGLFNWMENSTFLAFNGSTLWFDADRYNATYYTQWSNASSTPATLGSAYTAGRKIDITPAVGSVFLNESTGNTTLLELNASVAAGGGIHTFQSIVNTTDYVHLDDGDNYVRVGFNESHTSDFSAVGAVEVGQIDFTMHNVTHYSTAAGGGIAVDVFNSYITTIISGAGVQLTGYYLRLLVGGIDYFHVTNAGNAFIKGTLEVDGTTTLDGVTDHNGLNTFDANATFNDDAIFNDPATFTDAIYADNISADNVSAGSLSLSRQSSFRASNGSAFALSTTMRVITFNSENWDTNSEMAGSRFTAKAAGVYHACTQINCVGRTGMLNVTISKGGSVNSSAYLANATISTLHLCDNFNMAVGNYLEVYGGLSAAGACTSGSAATWFSVIKVT